MEEVYPKFISNHAIGYDLYEGKSQEKLAQVFSGHITNIDKLFDGNQLKDYSIEFFHLPEVEDDTIWENDRNEFLKSIERV